MTKLKPIGVSGKVPQTSYGAKFIRSMGGQFKKKMKKLVQASMMSSRLVNKGRIKM